MTRADGKRQMSVAVNLFRWNKLDSSRKPQRHPSMTRCRLFTSLRCAVAETLRESCTAGGPLKPGLGLSSSVRKPSTHLHNEQSVVWATGSVWTLSITTELRGHGNNSRRIPPTSYGKNLKDLRSC